MNRSKRPSTAVLASLALFFGACGGGGGDSAQAPVPPAAYAYSVPADTGDSWSIAHARDQGFLVPILEDMMNDIRAGGFPAIDSIAIAKGGSLILDETIRTTTDSKDTQVGNTNPAMHKLFSASKSITSILVGIAIDAGYISGVEAPYLSLFPYASYQNPDSRKNDITLQDALAMQLGLAWNEWDPPYSSAANQWSQFVANEFDFSKAVLDLPMAADPGTVFAYNTAATISLGQAVENAVPLTLIDYALDALFLPLGITNIEVTTTPTGLPDGGSGIFLLTRDALKFGQLLVNGGTWNGARIVSETWLNESLIPRTALGLANPAAWDWVVDGYGYQWWLGHYELNGVTYDCVAAWGFGGQWIIAIPTLDLVVAVYSHGYDGSDNAQNQAHALIREYLFAALSL